ncbi:sorbosone dehydrogenase family protein [Ideonella azotifigens]|uniref:Sorbosone dehydrogenase family protein n=3 Tax=Ideonella azotifigens TaxID=513160 RepID=A0ABN1KJX4_9BURK|nr:sorbosone dehydrogenase family protein [Ideonella azotifigens]MCD2339328.1 sorbosone dehydrogenase family protein [Ideonella azotifigens]
MTQDEGAQEGHQTPADLQQGRVPILSTLAMAAVAIAVGVAGLTGCVDGLTNLGLAADDTSHGVGPDPALPAPQASLIPTVNIAEATGWAGDAKPQAAPGTQVRPFAKGLDHPRWLYVLPNGDVLVAESTPPKGEGAGGGLKGFVMGLVMARAGAGTPSANRITLLRDADGDGIAETRRVFLANLYSPYGMALVGDQLYVANADSVMRYTYIEGSTAIDQPGVKVSDLPGGPINHHWTKNILASKDGDKLYATVGSNSNVGEKGLDNEAGRAAIWEIDLKNGEHRIFASGLRNPNGLVWEPATGTLWTVVNERDELGDDLVPDYLTSVQDGGFYGWPWSYHGPHVDPRVKPQRPDMVARALKPDYTLGSHVAPLGLCTTEGATTLPDRFQHGMFAGLHGSWNRRIRTGYSVIFVPFQAGKPSGPPVELLTGFLDRNGKAQGRPVGVTVDKRGGLLVADDVGNAIWRVTGAV